jgi:hypothetical protein
MAELTFTVAYSTSIEGVTGLTPNVQVYAEDLGNCGTCTTDTGSCWACLTTEQQIFQDSGLTNPVSDGYYMVLYEEGSPQAVMHVVGGYPQAGGFYNPPL